MKVVVSGSSGMIGSRLVPALRTAGHEVSTLRGADLVAGRIDASALAGVDAAIHLAGENIGARLRWSKAHKDRLLQSRVKGTSALSQALAVLDPRPSVLLSASAVGIYGDRGDEPLTEESHPGTGFLADLCQQWEHSTSAAEEAGIRVVHLRTGLVLDRRQGVLPKLLLPGRLGLGARFGSGRQWMSWIAFPDLIAALTTVLGDQRASGPVNLVSPHPATNGELVKTLGRVLRRPAVLALPSALLRLALGESAQEVLLGGQRVVPTTLASLGFRFGQPELEAALRATLAP